METSSLALSRFDCPDANSLEKASTTISPTSFIRFLIMARIIGSRIAGRLSRDAFLARLAIAFEPIVGIPPGSASCPIRENNFLA
jgi:hypothetical protein